MCTGDTLQTNLDCSQIRCAQVIKAFNSIQFSFKEINNHNNNFVVIYCFPEEYKPKKAHGINSKKLNYILRLVIRFRL